MGEGPLPVEEPGRHCLGQVVRAASAVMAVLTACTSMGSGERGTLPLWSPPQNPQPPSSHEKYIRQLLMGGHPTEHLTSDPQSKESLRTVTAKRSLGTHDNSSAGPWDGKGALGESQGHLN